MKSSYFLVLLMGICMSCTQSAEESTANLTSIISEASLQDAVLEETSDQEEISLTPLPGGITYSGEIGYYPVVMHLQMEAEDVSGHYFYTKKGKTIDLKGSRNSGTGRWKMTESVKGATTGYFDVEINEGGVTGQWSAKADMSSPLEVIVDAMDVNYDPSNPTSLIINGRYKDEHITITYEGDDEQGNPIEKEHEVKDEMAVRYIGDGYFSFWLSVIGANFHTGEVWGLGKMTDSHHATTVMEDCQLTFDFSKTNTVTVDEQDCSDYHGARAYFGVILTK